ncbi:MAG: SUMF1/EgtB/PvdO family nonheme iron enzyme, partial [Bacteroidota bacterium]
GSSQLAVGSEQQPASSPPITNPESPIPTRFLLIFDQFEEFFTYPEAQQIAFREQLAEALYKAVPQSVREAAEDLDPAARTYLAARCDVRAVFAIRADRLSDLDRMKDKLPAILHKRFELWALDEKQARRAITAPSALESAESADSTGEMESADSTGVEPFASPPFTWLPEAVDETISRMNKGGKGGGIEAFLLQILCQHVEGLAIAGKLRDVTGDGMPDVTLADLPDPERVFEEYYQNKIAALPAHQQEAARRVVEDGLLFVNPETEEARRLSKDTDELLGSFGKHGLTAGLLSALENTFLLRREANTLGGYSYEISHDTLIGAVLRSRKKREAEAARRKRRRLRLVGAAILLALAAAGMFWQKMQADRVTKKQSALAEQAKEQEAEAEKQAAEAKFLDSLQIEVRRQQLAAQNMRHIAEHERKLSASLLATTEAALQKLGKTSADLVRQLLENADKDILNLRYEAALNKINAAAKLNASQKSVSAKYLEIAFWHGETGDTKRAVGILDTAAALVKNAAVPALLRQATAAADSSRQRELLRQAMKRLDEKQFDSLYTIKYYPEMVKVEGGTFSMGCDSALLREVSNGDLACEEDEFPVHQVTLEDFRLARTETTVWQFALYWKAMKKSNNDFLEPTLKLPGDNPEVNVPWYEWFSKSMKKGNNDFLEPTWNDPGDNPVVNVNWYDAVEYCNWVSRQKSLQEEIVKNEDGEYELNLQASGFRLPTESEWEYAAKGGKQKERSIFSGSNNLSKVAWYAGNSSRTKQVAAKKQNSLGFFDMSGNVWEWCVDFWQKNYEDPPTDGISWTSGRDKVRRVVRGGSWSISHDYCRVAYRYRYYVVNQYNDVGFRLAR